ncbi:proline dehydrogenase [Kineococcus sp. R8]|uniref:proline dehydrogenase family protein n=1 Tax=Kineococcus siccus TaxID=2696567 RepID=UPI001411EC6D|nr:proline dehydrogenase [Kineococcus siccus]
MFGQALLGVAGNTAVRAAVTRSSVSRGVVDRFVAGEDVDQALVAVRALAGRGLRVTLDRLGEDVTDDEQAGQTLAGYRQLLDRLAADGFAAGNEVSVKLSALGQALGADGAARATERAHELVAHAHGLGVDVTLDMEDHTTVDATLATVRALRADFPRVGAVLQSALLRTEADARDLAVAGSRIRLVKGAYAEPPAVAFAAKADVDTAYVRCLQVLLEGDGYPMVATHDLRLVQTAQELARAAGRGPESMEFQMLFGIRTTEQQRLAAAGHTVRVYVPYGTDWYGYFSRRLAERPANLVFFARSLVTR